MNAPANISAPIRVDWTPAERAHFATISIHCPNSDEAVMERRVALAQLRDQASAGIGRASDGAAVLLGEVVRQASFAVYAPLPWRQLASLVIALRMTMEAARMLERAQRDG